MVCPLPDTECRYARKLHDSETTIRVGGLGRKTEAEALETKRRILIAALDVFFEKGFARSTLDDIADAAGMSRGAIYHHYENKQELLYTLHQNLHIIPYRQHYWPHEGCPCSVFGFSGTRLS